MTHTTTGSVQKRSTPMDLRKGSKCSQGQSHENTCNWVHLLDFHRPKSCWIFPDPRISCGFRTTPLLRSDLVCHRLRHRVGVVRTFLDRSVRLFWFQLFAMQSSRNKSISGENNATSHHDKVFFR